MVLPQPEPVPAWLDRVRGNNLPLRRMLVRPVAAARWGETGFYQAEERIPLSARIRDAEQGPDGMVYVLTDKRDGNVWRLAPLR